MLSEIIYMLSGKQLLHRLARSTRNMAKLLRLNTQSILTSAFGRVKSPASVAPRPKSRHRGRLHLHGILQLREDT